MEIFFDLEFEETLPIGDDQKEDLELLLKTAQIKLESKGLYNEELIVKSFWYCVEKHKDVIRKSGKPYYSHPLKVAIILLNVFPFSDSESVSACLLHDTIEDVDDVTFESIANEFNYDIAVLVDGVTKISTDNTSKEKNKALTYKKIFTALVQDIRIIMIKLADRLHNIRTLHYLKEEKQKVIALETLNFYTPIAHRLGLSRIKMELENLSFYFLDKETYQAIKQALSEKRKEFINYIKIFTDNIQKSLNDNNLSHTLSIVHKHEYEIYKMLQDGISLSDIDNFYSIVIILNSNDITDCYKAHGVLANVFTTINFLDYISSPKLDWNRSLNSELYGPDGKKVEIIIRTEEMESIAEEGYLSNKKSKIESKKIFKKNEVENWGDWVSDIIESKGEQAIPIIWNSIKTNLFDSGIKVFDKNGVSYTIPESSSVLDFAFEIYENDGIHCTSGKVNGIIKDIGYKLKDGDQVEIIISKKSFPKPDWNKFTVTNKAVVGLYRYFKEINKELAENNGEKEKYEFAIQISGEDRESMLQKITEAIGKNNMLKLDVDTTGNMFSAFMILKLNSKKELNIIFKRLFLIEGIRSVERIIK
jgi:RelA/SpoT family (p)ppGpp synthetase